MSRPFADFISMQIHVTCACRRRIKKYFIHTNQTSQQRILMSLIKFSCSVMRYCDRTNWWWHFHLLYWSQWNLYQIKESLLSQISFGQHMPSSNIHAHELTKQTTNANISLKCTIQTHFKGYLTEDARTWRT